MSEQIPPDVATKRIFTTGEAAAICKVSQQTIIRCFDAGRLAGFRVPGSKFRRIPREELLRFMKANGIPTDILEANRRRVLVVDDDRRIVEMYEDLLSIDSRLEFKTATTGYDAGSLVELFRPHLVLLDYMLPDINGNIVCSRIRSNPNVAGCKILLVSGVVRPEEIDALKAAGADDFLRKPFSVEQLSAKMSVLLGMEGVASLDAPPLEANDTQEG